MTDQVLFDTFQSKLLLLGQNRAFPAWLAGVPSWQPPKPPHPTRSQHWAHAADTPLAAPMLSEASDAGQTTERWLVPPQAQADPSFSCGFNSVLELDAVCAFRGRPSPSSPRPALCSKVVAAVFQGESHLQSQPVPCRYRVDAL